MREKIRMNSTAGTGHFYTTDKNKRTMPDKLEMKKYDPVARKHVIIKKRRSSNRRIYHRKPRPRAGVFGFRICTPAGWPPVRVCGQIAHALPRVAVAVDAHARVARS